MLTRLKLRLAGREKELTIAFALLGVVLLAGAAYVYAAPLLAPSPEPPDPPDQPTEPRTETEVVPNQVFSINASITDSAVVETGGGRYEEGEELREWPAYFYQYTPNLTLNITTTSTRNVTVDVRKRLISNREVTRDGEQVFVDNRTLMERNHFSITDGRTAYERTFDVRADLQEPADEVEDDFESGATEFDRQLILRIDYETERINGTRYRGQLQLPENLNDPVDPFRLESNGNAYWVAGDQTVSERRWNNSTRTVTLPPPDDPEPTAPSRPEPDLQLAGLLGLLGIASLGVGAVVAMKVPEIDETELRAQSEHEEYSEWISEGELVLDADNEYVYVSSIEDLVNVAIDTDKRVIHDPDLSVYTVTDGQVIYYYTTEPSDLQRWANI